jgi:AraC-like DNA-binding protein
VVHARSLETVEQLSAQFNLSQRQFERKFTEYAGFTPKVYSRIIRFQSALSHYGSDYKSLTDIAYECGYYDQSHFIHEFKEFSGYHPGQYFKGRPEGIEYREV